MSSFPPGGTEERLDTGGTAGDGRASGAASVIGG